MGKLPILQGVATTLTPLGPVRVTEEAGRVTGLNWRKGPARPLAAQTELRHPWPMPGHTLNSPLGPISVTERNGQITGLNWGLSQGDPTALTKEALRQLQAYFDRRLTQFDLPLDFGTGFAEQVRRAMYAIPLGETRSYGDLARTLRAPAQAIGQACGANPIPIIIPCHRVLGARSLGGFSAQGGVETKVWLLKHEGAASLLI